MTPWLIILAAAVAGIVIWFLRRPKAADKLVEAARQGDSAGVQSLLSQGVDVDARVRGGGTALMAAASEGREAMVQFLLASGADANARTDRAEITALMFAMGPCDKAVVSALLGKGADVNAQDGNGLTVLMNAAVHGKADIVETFVSHGADVNLRDDRNGSALIWAAANGRAEIVDFLIARGADVNARMTGGATALLMASMAGFPAVLRSLLAHGADVHAKDEAGKNAVDVAAAGWKGEPGASPKEEILKMLKTRMAEVPAPPAPPPSALRPAVGWSKMIMSVKFQHLIHAICMAGIMAGVPLALFIQGEKLPPLSPPVVVFILVVYAFLAGLLIRSIRLYRAAPPEEPIMVPVAEETIRGMRRRHSRKYPVLSILFSVALGAISYYSLRNDGRYNVLMVAMAPAFFLLGLGGLFDPDLMFGMRLKELPAWKKTVSSVLFLGGMAAGVAVCFLLSCGKP